MPNHKAHCAISKIRTGKDFSDLHEWMDGPSKELGIDHRILHHALDQKTLEFVKSKWGEKGVVEWMFHISLDYLWTAYKYARKIYGENTYNFFRFGLLDNGFTLMDHETLDDEELSEEFEDVYDEFEG